jgi:very-short-patch-repair endonuclease
MQYLVNQQDGYKYAWQSDQYVATICPICGHRESTHIGTLCKYGFSCSVCSDGISMPNKMMYDILSQLHVNFIREVGQKHFSWMKRYFYDFYFQTDDGIDVLIEMDGGLHDRIQEQQQRDKIKDELASQHNFKLIRIDCRYGNARQGAFRYIQSNILESELSSLLHLDYIDWDKCQESSKNNLLVQICNMWERELYNCQDIIKTLQLHRTTVTTYLKRGKDMGLCPSYNSNEALLRRDNFKRVMAVYDDTVIDVFKNINDCAEGLTKRMNIGFKPRQIQKCANGYLAHYHNINFKYITREEYEQYKMITDKEKI